MAYISGSNENISEFHDNYVNDELLNIIKSNFTESDMHLFNLNYKIYLMQKNSNDKFNVDFDEIYKWIGYTRKNDGKKILIKHFIKNEDYIISYPCKKINNKTTTETADTVSVISIEKQNGGQNKETILLTIECFKLFCMLAATSESKKIYKYYLQMEKCIFNYLENKNKEILELNKTLIEENTKKLQIKDKETHQLLQLKDEEIHKQIKEITDTKILLTIIEKELETIKNKKYEEVEKKQSVYIFSTDKQNIYKCGKSNNIEKRKTSLQTGLIDNIIILYEYKTSNNTLHESIVHNVLNNYRTHSNREHFHCNLDYMKLIIDISGTIIDTLKSSYENIEQETLIKIINDKLLSLFPPKYNKPILTNIDDSTIYNSSSSSSDHLLYDNEVPMIAKFLENIINLNMDKALITYGSSQLFSMFNEYIDQNKCKYKISSIRFGKDINSYEGIHKIKLPPIRKLNIDTYKLKKYLSRKYKMSFN